MQLYKLLVNALFVASAAAGAATWSRQSTLLNCTGNAISSRQCHMRNIVFDRVNGVFLAFQPTVFGPDGDRARALNATIHKTAFLQPGWNSWMNEPKKNRLRVQFQDLSWYPSKNGMCVIDEALHIRSPIMGRSFGHFIRDNLPFLLHAPVRFGRNPTDFSWVKWPTSMKFSGKWVEQNSPVLSKYTQLLTDEEPISWKQLLDKECGAHDGDKLNGHGGAVKRFVLLKEAIAGLGQMSNFPECKNSLFQRVRNHAYRRPGLEPKKRAQTGKRRVTFVGHHEHERRRLLNVTEAIDVLSKRFPDVEFSHVFFSTMHLKEQLEVLADTNVLVSTIGSASFRMVFLSDGAKVILVGSPEYEFKGEDGNMYKPIDPFKEVDECWWSLEYLEILRYRVLNPEEALPTSGRWDLSVKGAGENFDRVLYEQSKMWDADVFLEPHKLESLLVGILPVQSL